MSWIDTSGIVKRANYDANISEFKGKILNITS